ncbi:hypothetical protein ABI59_00115 [Acidobacteria bacterium Mor1]|nr:hypothetical protein ABI59_00115 [Acidobacteria bacterium Mor1]
MDNQLLTMLPLWYVVFLLSLTCHEAGHAFAAYRGGDPTAYLGGQVSLNPIPHVAREPIGTVLVPIVSFFLLGGGWMIGWASAPYDPNWEDRYPRRAAMMAFAGPLANLVLLTVGFVALKIGIAAGLWQSVPVFEGRLPPLDRTVMTLGEAGGADALGRFFSILMSLNLILFMFNLIPMPPMDGASILAGLFSAARRFRDWLMAAPMGSLLGLIVAWQLFPVILRPAYQGLIWALNQ